MKNVYFAQVAYAFGDNVHMPYTAGVLCAYAWQDEEVKRSYELKRLIYLRENIDECVDSLEDPFLVAFSCYIWNYEYNKALAKAVKARYPDCVILFGGHQISPGTKTLEELSFVDLIIHDEGEEAFLSILLSLIGKGTALSDIPNIAFRNVDGTLTETPRRPVTNTVFPSPYTTGVFDEIMKDNYQFVAFLETNRGCPYKCAYCDWGAYKASLRVFSMERVLGDIDWMSEHKIGFVRCTDGNFGILDRDQEIADYLINKKLTVGYPKQFRTAYAKNSDDRVFEMNRRFNEYGMCKGVTLSFQSLNPKALENVGRVNMPLERFKEYMTAYNEAGIPTYSELILGLPGETYDSFCEGVSKLIECGQHTSLAIYNCDLLVNAQMGQKEYIERFGLKTVTTYADRYHGTVQSDDIPEHQTMIVGTYSMDAEDWLRMNLYSACILSCHCLGLLQFIAIYLFYEKGVTYSEFYRGLVEYLLTSDSRFGAAFRRVKQSYENFIAGKGMWGIADEFFGNMIWPFEEYLFLTAVFDEEATYRELTGYLRRFTLSDELLSELMRYQRLMIRKPQNEKLSEEFMYDLHHYFHERILNRPVALEKRHNRLVIGDHVSYEIPMDYATHVVWYGRKGGKNLYGKVGEEYLDETDRA